eukprot:1312853-Prymnesium_polylepis.2
MGAIKTHAALGQVHRGASGARPKAAPATQNGAPNDSSLVRRNLTGDLFSADLAQHVGSA